MPIEGPLRELGIHDVFALLDLSRKTGVLRVSSELREDEGLVHFDGGRVVHASIRSKAAPLEIVLLRAGKISDEDLAAARARQSAVPGDSATIVDLLVESGAVTTREVERQARLQIESVVFELMSWREGFFSFEERSAGQMPRPTRVRIPTESLLMEGARRIDEWSRIADKVPSLAVIPMLAPVRDDAPAPQLELLPSEWEVLTMIDGERDLRAIAASLGRGEFEVAKVVYGLVATSVVELKAAERTSGATARVTESPMDLVDRGRAALRVGAADEALTAARRALDGDGACTPARLLASAALGRLGRYDEAVEELRRTVRSDPLTPTVHLDLGFAAVRVGDFAAARASWEHFLRLAPGAREAGRVRAAMETLVRLIHLLEAHAEDQAASGSA